MMSMAVISKFKLSEDFSYLYPHHRNGWRKAIEKISIKSCNNASVYLEPFFERVFGYNREDIHRVEIYKKEPWVAFVHEPPITGIPNSALSVLLLTEDFKNCLPNLKGIFCLTNAQKKAYEKYSQLENIPISVLRYPTDYKVPKWDIENLTYNVYEIGSHYRVPILEKLRLKQANKKVILNNIQKRISNEEYDQVLSDSIVIQKYFFQTAASTTLVECMAAYNPLFINKIEPVVEYLGEDYPNYYYNSNQLYKLFLNKDKLRIKLKEANEYLKTLKPLSYEKFIKDIINSEVYKSI